MNTTPPIDRRTILKMLSALPFAGIAEAGQAETAAKLPILAYIESLARPDGGYAWPDDPESTLATTYAVIACYRCLGEEPPRKSNLVQFVRSAYPEVLVLRKNDRPLHRFDYEQMQSLLWLKEPIESFRQRVSEWVRPYAYPKYFEMDGDPVLQQEVGAVLSRRLLGIAPNDEWRDYVTSRRRINGSFNNTPSSDGSDGHITNTLWGLLALEAIEIAIDRKQATIDWTSSCWSNDRGFTYAPHATLAAIDHVAYTWSAVKVLRILGSGPANPESVRAYLLSLWNQDGGFGDRPGRSSNPLATMQALEALSIVGSIADLPLPRRSSSRQTTLPGNLNIYSIQIEAPGIGSPREAAEMARALKIDLWGAKNSKPGWIESAQKIAALEKIPVAFFVSNEEYGTYVSIPGLGTYSHLADVTAAAGSNFGAPLSAKNIQPIPWPQFLARRIGPLRRAGGNNVWQYNQNEELSRILLDQAVEEGTYSSISSFHFAQNFLETQPFLNRYRDVMAFIALQDAHLQTWWWMENLVAFRTFFLAEQPTWESWLEALHRNWVVGVRHDLKTGFKTQVAGSSNAVRKYVMDQQAQWRWWGENPAQMIRPLASLVAVAPGDVFEESRPESGVNLRLRCWWNLGGWTPRHQVVELVTLEVDGGKVEPQSVHVAPPANGIGGDIYHLWHVSADRKGHHRAVATVRMIETGTIYTVAREFTL